MLASPPTATNRAGSGESAYCLALNLLPGQCYQDEDHAIASVTCPESGRDLLHNLYGTDVIRVAEVTSGERGGCADGQLRYRFARPARLICATTVAPGTHP